MRKIFLTFLFFFIVCSGYFLLNYLKNEKKISDFFFKKKIEQIKVFNLNFLSREYLINSIEIKKGDTFWNYSFFKLQKNLENINEIDEFSFNLKLDGTLNIYIKEKLPFMIWENNDKIEYIDENGNILNLNLPTFPNLITLHGLDANKKIKELNRLLLNYPSISSEISKIFLVNKKKWKLLLKNKSCLKLPEEKIRKALEVFKKIRNEKIYKDFKEFDMQINGRVYLNKEQCLT